MTGNDLSSHQVTFTSIGIKIARTDFGLIMTLICIPSSISYLCISVVSFRTLKGEIMILLSY